MLFWAARPLIKSVKRGLRSREENGSLLQKNPPTTQSLSGAPGMAVLDSNEKGTVLCY